MEKNPYKPPLTEYDSSSESESIHYAGFWSRVVATTIDSIWLYSIIYTFLYFVFNLDIFDPEATYTFVQFVFEWIIPLIVVMAFWILKSATPGKMLLGITIVDAVTLDKVPAQRLFLRYIAYFVAYAPLFLGILWLAWDVKKQGWHDKIARTVLIKKSLR